MYTLLREAMRTLFFFFFVSVVVIYVWICETVFFFMYLTKVARYLIADTLMCVLYESTYKTFNYYSHTIKVHDDGNRSKHKINTINDIR